MTRRLAARQSLILGLTLVAAATFAAGEEIQRGEVLAGELNCVACHRASGPVTARLASRESPVLGERGRRLTPQWLRDYLRDPSASKPGTTMPDALHALHGTEKEAAAEALAQYLISLQPNGERSSPEEYADATVAKGRTLYHAVGCVACHDAQDPPKGHSSADVSEASIAGAPLGYLASKMSVSPLAAFLKDPLATMPSGRMPSLHLDDAEATAIAMYLLRAEKMPGQPAKVPGLIYEYYEVALEHLPRFERLHAKTRGVASGISLSKRERDDNFALRFTGNITIPLDGDYTFIVTSDDGARLLIDDKEVLANDGVHAATEGKGSVVLTRGEHALTVLYFNGTGGRALEASWQGPDFARQPIPAAALSHAVTLMQPLGADPDFAVDAAQIERGKALFASLNCAACHAGVEGWRDGRANRGRT